MQLEIALLSLIVLLLLALGAGLLLLWRWMGLAFTVKEGAGDALDRELGRFERYLDGKVDLILAQLTLLEGAEPPAREKQQSSTREDLDLEAPMEGAPPPGIRPRLPRGRREISETDRLDALLSSPGFGNGVWTRMDGTFDVASAHLLGFLAAQGITEPRIEPHPASEIEHENHWDFLVLWSPEAGEKGCRFLIPRNFSRYDPALHDHLFQVLGGGATLENFFRELRRCAVLRGAGPLQGFIPPEVVKRKGVVVV